VESTYLLAKGVLKPWLATWFKWSIEGLENVPRSGPALLAFNHIAYLDPLAAAYVVDRAHRVPRFLAKSELFEDKKIGWVLRGAKQIEVRRGSKDAPMALEHAFAALKRGELIVVFPEGTITTDPDLKPMRAKTGTARLALGSGVPVVPCALWGTANIWPKGHAKRWRPRVPGRVGVRRRPAHGPDSGPARQPAPGRARPPAPGEVGGVNARVAFIGAGSWGTATASLVARKDEYDTVLWARRAELAETINLYHENPEYLPGLELPEQLRATNDLEEALDGAGIVASGPS
jgi:1-acyl-sn-glycerol-3-phosphate acyltransferase